MFSNDTINLKSIATTAKIDVVRDCAISYVGKIPTRLPRRLVPCARPEHIEEAITKPDIAGIVTTPENAALVPEALGLVLSDDPIAAALELHEALCTIDGFHWNHFETRIHPTAQVHPSAIIAENDVEIGAHCVIGPGAIIMPRVIMSEHCAIGPGTVVGTDAFEVNTRVSPHRILKQAGGVRLAAWVEIQAKCTIARATFGGFTEIGEESKFECQVHLAHDCRVGRRVRVVGCSSISGRVTIGDDSTIGPNCTISNGLTIGKGAYVTLGAVVTRDVPDGQRVSGNFAVAHDKLIAHVKTLV